MFRQTVLLCILFGFESLSAVESVIYIENLSEYHAQLVSDDKIPSDLTINGGYFDMNRRPVGYFMRQGAEKQSVLTKKLSGLVVISKQGRIDIQLAHAAPKDAYEAFQSGPFLIDPGGKMGIRTADKYKFDRMVLIKNKKGIVSLLFHKRITLYELASYIQKHYPDTDMALNLDGGPSCCLKGMGHAVTPNKALPYYIAFTSKSE